jgi:hypothetical protein
MSGKPSGVEKRVVLVRIPMPLYEAVMETSKGLNIQAIILATLRMKYGKVKPRKLRTNGRETKGTTRKA